MQYHNYREKKEKGLAKVNKRTITEKIVSGGEVKEKEQTFFDLEIAKFNEEDGTPRPYPERHELDVEVLEKEKVRLQGFIGDIDEILADIEVLRE